MSNRLVVVAGALLPSIALASGGSGHGFTWGVQGLYIVDFVVLIALLVILTRKKFAAALTDRAAGIRKDIDEATSEHDDARKVLDEKEGNLRALQADRPKLEERFRDEAVREHDRVIAEADARARRLVAETERQIEAERRRLADELRGRLIDQTFETARVEIRASMTDEARRRWTDDAVTRLEKVLWRAPHA